MSSESKPSIARSLLSSGLGPALSQGITLAAVPVLFRLYSPQDFGVWAAAQAIAVVIGSLVTLRYDLSLVIERDNALASQLLFATLALVASFSVAIGGALLIVPDGVLQRYGIRSEIAVLTIVWFALLALFGVLQSWLMRDGAFTAVSISVICNALVTNLLQLFGGWMHDGIWLIIGSVAGVATAVCLLVWRTWTGGAAVWPAPDGASMWAQLKVYRRFPLLSMPFTALSLLRERASVLIIGAYAPAVAVGLYSQAWRLSHFPAGFTSSAIRPVLFHRTASEGLAAQASVVDRLVTMLLVTSSVWIGVVGFGDTDFFETLLGPSWHGVFPIFILLIGPATLFTVSNWMDRILDVAGRQDLNLKLEIVAGVGSTATLWGALAAGGSLVHAVACQSVVLVLSYLGLIWLCYGAAGWPRRRLYKAFAVSVLTAAATFAVLSLGAIILPKTFVFIAGCFVALIVSLLMLYRARQDLR